jgi:hypothetical protein
LFRIIHIAVIITFASSSFAAWAGVVCSCCVEAPLSLMSSKDSDSCCTTDESEADASCCHSTGGCEHSDLILDTMLDDSCGCASAALPLASDIVRFNHRTENRPEGSFTSCPTMITLDSAFRVIAASSVRLSDAPPQHTLPYLRNCVIRT